MNAEGSEREIPTRQEPPPFRRLVVRRVEPRTPRLTRIVLGGPELDGFEIGEPAASVRLLLPPPGQRDLVLPAWTGNQFELPTGERAPIRTLTPRHLDTTTLELTVEIVRHEEGLASTWASRVEPGEEAAVSGPGRGYDIDTTATAYLLAGDETALPAICQILEAMPDGMPVEVHVELADPAGRLELPDHPGAEVRWHELPAGAEPGDALVTAVEALPDVPDAVWVAGEAAAVQRIRKHLFDVRGMTRAAATVRGYWKKGRSAT